MPDEQQKPDAQESIHNDTTETWDHLCGADPNWSAIVGEDEVEDE